MVRNGWPFGIVALLGFAALANGQSWSGSVGGTSSGFGGGWYGGYQSGSWTGGYDRGHPYGYGLNLGYTVPSTSYGYNSSPLYGYGSSYPAYGYYRYGTYRSTPSTIGRYTASYTPRTSNTVLVIVTVPADAKVWFEGRLTRSTGTVRSFESPPLQPGKGYTYKVRATWTAGDKEVTQTQDVDFRAGDRVRVIFPTK